MEKCIALETVRALIAAKFAVTVNDGEEDVLKASRDESAILAAMFSTDEDLLFVRRPIGQGKTVSAGWIRFIYGNDGFDVINDYTTSLESVLAPIVGIEDSSIASRLESGKFRIVLD
jgi:hypothetical protein